MPGSAPLVDIVVTHFPKNERRRDIAWESLRSLVTNTSDHPHRLTWVTDGGGSVPVPEAHRNVVHRENRGLGPSVNEAMMSVISENEWYEQRGEASSASQLVCYLQDDVLYTPGWLTRLTELFLRFESALRIGFATGIECPEHPVRSKIRTVERDGFDLWTKDWIRMTCMLARREYWKSMLPIHGMDPETGRPRARPNDGIGSGCDWWLIRNHPNSVCRTGRTNLVVPGLLTHVGYRDSTWLDRELPESDRDRETACAVLS